MIIKNNFERCTLEEGEKLGEFFHRLSEVRQQLAASPAGINDHNFMYQIFKVLKKIPRFQIAVSFLQIQLRTGNLTSDAAMNEL